jgi:hypothetical protein
MFYILIAIGAAAFVWIIEDAVKRIVAALKDVQTAVESTNYTLDQMKEKNLLG